MPESRPLAAVVLAAGLGTRMRSERAKVLHELGGRPLLRYPLAALATLDPKRVVLVVGHQAEAVAEAARAAGLTGLQSVLQAEQHGTGHAVRCAAPALADFRGDVVILYGDVPMIRPATLEALMRTHRTERADLTLLTVRFPDPTGYGRIVRGGDGRVRGIVEQRDATPAQRAITEINPGFYCIRAEVLFPMLRRLRANNAQGELYLTDLVGMAAGDGLRVASLESDSPEEVAGINTRVELARMEALVRDEQVRRWMDAGVTFEDPATAYLGPDVTIGKDTVVGPNVTLRGKTRIGKGCRLEGTSYLTDSTLGDGVHLLFGCHLDGAQVGDDARIGPFARLRPGTQLAERVHVGNFVETKKASLGAGAKANHLTYLGDCEIGPGSNIGAGTITCNYDGYGKYRTTIGARVFVGSDTQFVAPVTIADDAYVGAGTTVTRDVPSGALAVSRVPMRNVEGWVPRFRERMSGGAAKVAPAPVEKPKVRAKPRASKPAPRRAAKGRVAAKGRARRRG
jgi:bifunctional UDP-N-acetylglucosamine pyrophosphorylase/glucosamine-1-phosphate N-acetyltransferase